MPAYGLILLAAGCSSRMGSPKQLLAFRGKPLIRHAAEVALASTCRPVWVVLGAREPEVREALAGLPVELLVNPRWAEGMGTSVRAGIEAALGQGVDGVVLALADQPLVSPETYDRLVGLYRETGLPMAAAEYNDTVGVPAFFSAALFPELLALTPDAGCKRLLRARAGQVAHLSCPEAAVDVDTPEDLTGLQ